jgi:hypothetical protein
MRRFALFAGVALTAVSALSAASLRSAGPIAFGPNGVLFVSDPLNGAIHAFESGDTKAGRAAAVNVTDIQAKIAALLGTTADQIRVNDMAVNPASHNIYFSVSRGMGPDAKAAIVVADAAGKVTEFPVETAKSTSVTLENIPADTVGRGGQSARLSAITDIGYADGKVIVAGLSNEEFSSKLRTIAYPFSKTQRGSSIEIYHGNHGRLETNSPVRTFTTMTINNELTLLAAYTCTPLVRIPMSQLKDGEKINGATIAEFGAGNTPLDMVVYNKGGANFILMNNTSLGVMKIQADKLDTFSGITERVGGTAGVPFEKIATLAGVDQMDKWDDSNALVLMKNAAGSHDLKSIALP